MENKITEGNILNVLIGFAFPYFLSSFLQTFYGMADLYIIGQFEGASSLSSVSIGSQFIHMLTVIIIGLSMGTTICMGHAMGRENKREISSIMINTVFIFTLIAIILTIILYINTNFVVQIMSTPSEAIQYTKDYLAICFIGIPFIVAYNVISSIYRGMGDSKKPMIFIFIACLINIILDYYFIGMLSLGVKGAAFATVIAQAISSIIAVIYLMKRKNEFGFQKQPMAICKSTIKKIVSIGLPIALQDGFIQISFLLITIIANSRGLIAATSVGVVEKIISFLFLVPSAILSALSALIAHNVGAGKTKRADLTLKYAIMICVIFGLIFSLLCQIIPKRIVGLFTQDIDVIISGVQYLRSYSLDCIFAGIHFCFSGYFCGFGYSTISFIHNLISVVLIRIPVSYLASLFFPNTLLPMGLSAPLGSVLSIIICIGYYIYLKKNENTIRINTIDGY